MPTVTPRRPSSRERSSSCRWSIPTPTSCSTSEEGGKTVRWQAELGGPQQLVKQFGWTPSTVKKGVKITLTGRRLKSGAPYLNLTERANVC